MSKKNNIIIIIIFSIWVSSSCHAGWMSEFVNVLKDPNVQEPILDIGLDILSNIIEEKLNKQNDLEKQLPERLSLIPQSADFVIIINVTKLLAIPEIQELISEKFEKQPAQKKTYEQLKIYSGFDPLKDISNIILFSSGKVVDGQEILGGAIIEGKFDVDKIIKLIKEDKNTKKDVELTVIDGFNYVVPKNNKDGYGIFLDNQHVVIGNKIGVNAVKEVKKGKAKTIQANIDFLDIINKIDSNAAVSGAGILPQAFKDKCAKNPNAASLAKINTFCFDLNKDRNLVFNLNIEVDKKENVNNVMTQVNGYLAMIKMFAGQAGPEIAEAANMLTATNTETTIKLSLDVPAAKVAEIKAKIEEKAKNKTK